jgi:phage/plasmid-associated DNA primase
VNPASESTGRVRKEQLQNTTNAFDTPVPNESKCTDLANGQRFAQQWSEKAKFVASWKTWLVWDGTRWAGDGPTK